MCEVFPIIQCLTIPKFRGMARRNLRRVLLHPRATQTNRSYQALGHRRGLQVIHLSHTPPLHQDFHLRAKIKHIPALQLL